MAKEELIIFIIILIAVGVLLVVFWDDITGSGPGPGEDSDSESDSDTEPQDCVWSWQPWSPCTEGKKTRRQRKRISEKNGGKCPPASPDKSKNCTPTPGTPASGSFCTRSPAGKANTTNYYNIIHI